MPLLRLSPVSKPHKNGDNKILLHKSWGDNVLHKIQLKSHCILGQTNKKKKNVNSSSFIILFLNFLFSKMDKFFLRVWIQFRLERFVAWHFFLFNMFIFMTIYMVFQGGHTRGPKVSDPLDIPLFARSQVATPYVSFFFSHIVGCNSFYIFETNLAQSF